MAMRETVQVGLRAEKLQELSLHLFVLRCRLGVLLLFFDLAGVLEPLPDSERPQTFAAVYAAENLGDDFPRSLLSERSIPRHVRRPLPLRADDVRLALARLACRFFQPSPLRVRERAVPEWAAALRVFDQ